MAADDFNQTTSVQIIYMFVFYCPTNCVHEIFIPASLIACCALININNTAAVFLVLSLGFPSF